MIENELPHMLPAPTFDEIERMPLENRTPVMGLLFAPPFTKTGKEMLIPRLGYLDERSGRHTHFFCAGYGGYRFAEDQQHITDMRYDNGVVIPWGFSDRKYAQFVDELEQHTSWKMRGEAELILVGGNLDFRDTLVFDVEAMVADGAIRSAGRLFEAVISFAKALGDRATPASISDRKGLSLLGDAAATAILELVPNAARELWTRGRYYATRDLHKRVA